MRTARADERSFWNEFVSGAPNVHFLQSWEWGEFKSAFGWQPIRLLFLRDGRPCAAASMLKRSAGPLCMFYVPKGPIVDFADEELAGRVLDVILDTARRHHAIYVKVDPDIHAEDSSAIALLTKHGFNHSEGQIQVPVTMMLSLEGTEEDVLGRMKPKWRYNIKLAERRGVEAVPGTPDDFPELYRIYQETGRRDMFIVRPYEYCRQQWALYLERGMAAFWLAKYEGRALAGIIPFAMGRRVWYMLGASGSEHRNLMPTHLLQWRAMQWGRERGCTEYDMWGAPETLEEGQPLWGVYLYKQGFGAEYVRWAGAYDCVLQPTLHTMWTRLVPAYVGALRRLRGERADERQLVGV